jgi:hypothetical protein
VLHPIITSSGDEYRLCSGTRVVIENVQKVISSVKVAEGSQSLISKEVSELYATAMPSQLKEAFYGECSEERSAAVIREAAEMAKYKGVLISFILGKDVTEKDLREGTTFWDENQSGRGPVLFRALLDTILGDIVSNPIMLLLFRGPFRDVFETVIGKCEFTVLVLIWLRLYFLTGN